MLIMPPTGRHWTALNLTRPLDQLMIVCIGVRVDSSLDIVFHNIFTIHFGACTRAIVLLVVHPSYPFSSVDHTQHRPNTLVVVTVLSSCFSTAAAVPYALLATQICGLTC